MKPPRTARSQVIDLFLGVAEALGFTTDLELAALADAGPESVSNWKNGVVRELKPQKLRAAILSLEAHIRDLHAQAGAAGPGGAAELTQLEIERGASPADLQRDFRQRISYDYVGHRFLYYEPQGALAWESLIRGGYEQDLWLAGIERCIRRWLPEAHDKDAPLARALGLGADRTAVTRGLDFISLGCGEAGKEALVLRHILAVDERLGGRLPWLAFAPVDVSIPLLLTAARTGHSAFADAPAARRRLRVSPFCSDFEEGRLEFRHRLRTAHGADGLRLIVVLGNVFGNLRDEELFIRRQLAELCRPGDMVWLEVGLRPDDLDRDPLYALTRPDYQETPSAANRRLLLEGPYRRAANAMGTLSADVDLRIHLREGDESARIPGSINFTHDIHLRAERRSFTMLYSRRYQLAPLVAWLERLGYDAVATERIADQHGTHRVCNLLLRRRSG